MTKARWTVLLLRGETDVKQFSLPVGAARALIAGLCVSLLLLAGTTAFLAFGGSSRVQAMQLAKENALLEAELDRVQTHLAKVDQDLTALAERDERVRLLAGMAGIDEEILQVGVGGPGMDVPEDGELWELDPSASEAAYAIRYDLDVLERRVDLLTTSMTEAADSMEAHRQLLESTPSILPTAGLLSSRFNPSRFHPILHRFTAHEGVDVHALEGTPILAAANGRVKHAGWKPGYGNTVIIEHGYGFSTLYGHASQVLVKAGQRVRRGEVVAQVGSTGLATASHLHYEVHVGGNPVNPMNYVIRGAVP